MTKKALVARASVQLIGHIHHAIARKFVDGAFLWRKGSLYRKLE